MKLLNKTKLLLVLLAAITLVACTGPSDFSQIDDSGNIVALSSIVHDWGDINIKGGDVKHTFTLKNDSDESLYLKGAQTSCMCTTARFKLLDDSISPMYGMHNNDSLWSTEIKPGDEFRVEAIFDPMAHGPDAVGIIQRSVILLTSDPDQPTMELKVGGDVVYEEDFSKES